MTGEADAGKIEPDAWRDQTWIWLDSHDISRTFDPDAKGECPCVTMARISEPAPSPLACPRRVSRQFQECQRDAKGVRHRPKRHAERRWQARSGPSTLRVSWAKAIPYQRVIETIRGERDSEPGAKRAWRVEASAEKSITPRWGTRKSFHGRRCASRVMKHAWVPEYAGDSERLFARACALRHRAKRMQGPTFFAVARGRALPASAHPGTRRKGLLAVLHRGMGCGRRRLTRRPPPSRLASSTRPPCASVISRASARPRPVPERLVE